MLTLRKRADKTGEEPLPSGSWPLDRVELMGDAPAEHNFADTFVARAMADGYLEFENVTIAATEVDGTAYSRGPVLTGDALVLHLADGDLRYRIVEHPGRYAVEGGVEEHHEYRCELVA